ncbi:MAG: MFS transporter, partial [Myxococcaceae bacterium]|nr:MFS transporter [Myxococcaceae bacterium]
MNTSTKRAGWLLLALTLLNVLNFADRYLLIGFSTVIIPELGLSNLQFGLLTGVVFTAVYTVFGMFAGSLADRVHRPRLIASGLTLWSALTAATGMAGSFVQMAAARVLIGVGEAGLTPAALSLLADRMPPERRAFASGVYYLGLPVGIGGSFIFAGAMGPLLGWRGSFMLLGALGIAAALLVVWLMRDPARSARSSAAVTPSAVQQRGGSFAESFRAMAHELRTNTAFALTIFGVTAMVFAQGAAVLDLVWWVRERGFTLGEAQRLNGLVFLVGGVVGAVLGGTGADWAHRRYVAGRLKFLAWAFVLSVPMALAYRLVPGHSPMFLVLAFGVAVLGLLL